MMFLNKHNKTRGYEKTFYNMLIIVILVTFC